MHDPDPKCRQIGIFAKKLDRKSDPIFPILSDFFRFLDFSRLSDSTALVESLLFLTSSITITKNQKSKQLMSGNLAGQAMVLRSTWKSAGACKTVAGASFDGSL